MRALRLSLAIACLAAAPLGAQAVSKDATPAASAAASAADPVGTYEWSLLANDQAFNGTLVVSRAADASLAAVVTASSDPNPMKAKSVTVADGDRLVVLTDTPYGEFTMDVKLGPTLAGRWSIGDGTSNGELKIARTK